MTLEHVAIWTADLEKIKDFYVRFFQGKANQKYTNTIKGFESYFIEFDSGARLEIVKMASIPPNRIADTTAQHLGIIHIAFGMSTKKEVDEKAEILRSAGYPILSGPRKTGDGYYEFETLDPEGNRLEVTTAWANE